MVGIIEGTDCTEHWGWCKNNEYCYAENKEKLNLKKSKETSRGLLEGRWVRVWDDSGRSIKEGMRWDEHWGRNATEEQLGTTSEAEEVLYGGLLTFHNNNKIQSKVLCSLDFQCGKYGMISFLPSSKEMT